MPANRKQLWLAAKSVLALLIVVFVTLQFRKVLANEALRAHPLAIHWEWLVPAGLLYLGAHVIWAWFWVRLLWNQGVDVRFLVGLRAYFISQFGKYVPGKAWVILM